MDAATFCSLLAPAGQRLLALTAQSDLSDGARLRTLTALRREASAELATAAYDTAMLRARARTKFSRANAMYFTRESLEQATGEAVARHRARRFAGRGVIADLGCGIGGDTLALAGAGRVVGVERDTVRLRMARENALAYGVEDRTAWVQGDLANGGPLRADVAFVDPARRSASGRRTYKPNDYQPPLGEVLSWRTHFSGMAVKVAPGIADEDVASLDGEVEFVAHGNDLKECVLWLGALAATGRRATVLPDAATLRAERDPPAPLAAAGSVLYEPNPAVIRAHLIGTLAAMLGAWQIDRTIAFLSSDGARPTPFARAWSVESVLPFSVDGVRRHLRSLDVGRVTVKKRGSPLEPEAFARMLHLRGTGERTVVLTREMDRHVALICTGPLTPGASVSPIMVDERIDDPS